jgi:pSer/pThr/pTyr-binding forkhead associated (FHA) protein
MASGRDQTTAQLPFSETPSQPVPPSLLGQELKPAVETKRLTFVIPSSGRRLTLDLDNEIRVGRLDPVKDIRPELDLTEDNGAEHGVSRLHATIQSSNRGLVLVDLGSTNGTLLNNYRLPPDLPYPLHNGDEIRFGRLLVHVFFEK